MVGLRYSFARHVVSLLSLFLFFGCGHLRSTDPAQIQWNESVRRELKAAISAPLAGGERLTAPQSVARFYRDRSYTAAWVRDGSPSNQVEPLIRFISSARDEGLLPSDYHNATLVPLWKAWKEGGQNSLPVVKGAAFDLLLTDAYLLYGSHLAGGKVEEEDLEDKDGFLAHRRPPMTAILRAALEDERIEDSLKELQPDLPGFAKLRKALEEYRTLAQKGGWPAVARGPVVKLGQSGARVAALKRRLIISGELSRGDRGDETRFDDDLQKAVSKFQASHGLRPDGILTPRTTAELNVPVEARLGQIQANLERWRWLSWSKEDRYLEVNTADYRVQLFEGGKPVLSMRAIIGLRDNETPVFTDEMTHLVVNPSWYVPHTIAAEEILPKIKKDPAYVEKMDIQIFEKTGKDRREVNATSIDWGQVSEDRFPYQLRQAPGPNNPLGAMKFIFPNPHGVYLHGTINQKLFEKDVRAFSHGCIRIENPLALAVALLKDGDTKWDRQKLRLALVSGEERTIPLPKPLPIHILYWTTWVSEADVLQFRPDIYSWDRTLVRALRQPTASPKVAE